MAQTPLFKRGWAQNSTNVMKGTFAGYETSVFDYSFTTGTGKTMHTCTQTVVVFQQNLPLPVFELRPENIVDRIGEALLHKNITFDSHPAFSPLHNWTARIRTKCGSFEER
jgi:hypothetical protein